jgi:hypothetical protein
LQKAQQPLQPHPYDTADAPQRDPLQQETGNQRPLLVGNQVLVSVPDKLAFTLLALVVLFAIMNVTIF